MQSYRNRLPEIRLSHNHRDRRASERVAEDYETGGDATVERDSCFSNDRHRRNRRVAKLCDRIGCDRHKRCLVCMCGLCSGLAKEQGGE